MRGNGNRMDVMGVHEIEVVNVGGVEDSPVANKGVADVDPLDETVAAMKPREERFTKAQRKPADAPSETEAETAATKETDKSGAEDRPSKNGSRAPAPPVTEKSPTAIVERCKAPGCVVVPSPPPRANPVPVTRTVWRPTLGHRVRIPHRAFLGLFAPSTVVVEIGIAGNVARDIFRGGGVVFLQIALVGPAIQAVGLGCLRNRVGYVV